MIIKKLNIGDTSDNGQITIVDEDKLCYLVKSTSRGAFGLRTISKELLSEYVAYFDKHPDATANDARDALSGNSDIDKFEYGYTSTLKVMAQMVLGQINVTSSSVNTSNQNQPSQQIFSEVKDTRFSIKELINSIQSTGLIYSDILIKRLAYSLMAKPFVILSGLAGSGKTQLALAFASAMVKNKDEQMCVVSVGADWTNREPLLGFPNALQAGKYVMPESGVLDLLIEANRPENANKPFFLILDEMNMSYVERYFADFLSAMESKEAISLWNNNAGPEDTEEVDGVPQKVALPKNLFIIGTINVDETTYMFSPKVLDRANVIEFKISEAEMAGFLDKIREVNRDSIIGKAAGMGASFVEIACQKELAEDKEAVNTLKSFFKELKGVNAEFGYRSATEILRFICQAKAHDDTDKRLSDNEILDAAIVQKLLPKLHGSRKKLEPVLQQLWKLCFAQDKRDTTALNASNVSNAVYKESADKIRRMYESAMANGFTSFAEA
jgi:5-methylcytosine-specific restriction protein B